MNLHRPMTLMVAFACLVFFSTNSFAQCDSTGLAHDSLQWVVMGPTGSPSVGGTYRVLSSIKKYNDTLYLGGAFNYVGRYTGSCIGFDTSTGDYININGWPRINGDVKNVISDGSGGLIIMGKFTRAGDSLRNNIVRISSTGAVTSFNPNVSDTVLCGLVHNGKLYIGGAFSSVNGNTRNGAAAFSLSTGALDNSWIPNTGTIRCMETDGSSIYLGGSFSSAGGAARNCLAAVNMTNGAATAFVNNANSTVFTMKIYNGRLYFGGWFTTVNSVTRNKLASVTLATNTLDSWNPNVTSQYPWGLGGQVATLDVGGSKVYIGGLFDKVGTANRWKTAAIDTGTGLPNSWGASVAGSPLPGTGVLNGESIRSLKVVGNRVYVCGRFNKGTQLINSTPATVRRINFAAIDTSANYVTNLSINGCYNPNTDSNYTFAECVNVINGKLYIGGSFGSFGGHYRRNLAAIDLVNNKILETFKPVFGFTSYLNDWSYINQIDIEDDTLYAVGYADSINGVAPTGAVYRFAINNGYSFTSLPITQALELIDVKGNYLYGGGNINFTQSGQTHKGMARYNKSTGALDNAWAPDFDVTHPYSMLAHDNFASVTDGGNYTLNTYNFAASQEGKGSSNWYGFSQAIRGKKIFVGGNMPDGALAFDTTVTYTWPYYHTQFTTWNPKIGFYKTSGFQPNEAKGVFAIETAKSRVYMGGGFDTVNNQLRGSFVVVDTATGAAYPWKTFLGYRNWFGRPNLAEYVRDIELVGDTVFIGGDFNAVNGTNMAGLVRFHFNNFAEPQVTLSANDTSVCTGASVTVTANVNVSVSSYQWKKNGTTQTGSGSTFVFTPSNNDTITCAITAASGGCYLYTTAASNELVFTVTNNTTSTIALTAVTDTLCSGDTAHFSVATNMTGAGFQWKVGSTNVGTNSTTYSYAPSNGQNVSCTVTKATGACYVPASISDDTTMTVITNTVPAISISASANPVCPTHADTITASTNITGGTYQWLVNGSTAGTNSNTYIYTPANNDVVECVINVPLTGCFTKTADTSTSVTITHMTPVVPDVNITSADTVLCAGSYFTFSSTATNGGGTPVYQWLRNGQVIAGAVSTPFSVNSLQDNDVISLVLKSNAVCPIPEYDTSNEITVHVNPVTAPSVNIAANPGTTISQGTSVTFTATPANVGASPTYQWQLNGADVSGAVTNTYITNTLADNDQVSVIVYSSDSCSNPDTALSSSLAIVVSGIGYMGNVAGDIQLFPNPNNGSFIIKGKHLVATDNMPVVYKVTDVVGRQVLTGQTEVSNGVFEKEIALPDNTPAGVYYFIISIADKKETLMFNIQR